MPKKTTLHEKAEQILRGSDYSVDHVVERDDRREVMLVCPECTELGLDDIEFYKRLFKAKSWSIAMEGAWDSWQLILTLKNVGLEI